MFFVFHVLIIIFFCINCSNNFILRNSTNYKINKVNIFSVSTSQDAVPSNKSFSTYKPFMEYLQNLTKTQKQINLKQNIFDKMLSEEILSIKQHFHDKDSSFTPILQVASQKYVAKPTLEVKQRWPIERTITINDNTIRKKENDKMVKNPSNNQDKVITLFRSGKSKGVNDIESNNDDKDKVVGVRSTPQFSGVTKSVKCTCKQTITTSTCDSRKRETDRMCTHCGSSDDDVQVCTHAKQIPVGDCTHTTTFTQKHPVSVESQYYAVPFSAKYYAAFLQNIDSPYDIPNYPITTMAPEDVDVVYNAMEQTSQERNDDDCGEDGENDEDNNDERDYLEDSSNPPKCTPLKEVNLDSNYGCNSDRKRIKPENVRGDTIFVIKNKEKLVNDLVNDLKMHHSDALIKDCYCSVFSKSTKSNGNLLFIVGICCSIFFICSLLLTNCCTKIPRF